MTFESSELTKLFVHKEFLKARNFSDIPNVIELQKCVKSCIDAYEAEGIDWTVLGYYKPAVKGKNYNSHY